MEVIMKNQYFIKSGIKSDIIDSNNKYLIDTMIADVYLANNEEGTPSNIMRPIVYFALDIHSELIAGIHVDTLNDQLFNGVKKVISNCNEDKTEFCKKYNIEITNEWPLAGFPHTILLNIAEFNDIELKILDEEFHINVEYDRYLLGRTSRSIELICKEINYKINHRFENKIDIYDFIRVVIYTVIEHNKSIIEKNHQK
jgi:hypothetical protein